MLNTILKAGEVLSLYDHEHAEWRVSDVAEVMGIAKSSAHDLMSSLTQIGLLSQTDQGRYRLGWKIVELSETLLATTELRSVARPVMEELMYAYQETLHLAILQKGKVVYVDKIEGKQTIRVELTGLGTHLYPHCSGVGKVLLAHLPWSYVEDIIAEQGLPHFTDRTIVEVEQLKIELTKVREEGCAYDMGEIIPDLRCVAAPIRDYKGRVIASISMSVPFYRFERSHQQFRLAIVRAAQTISRYLGYIDSSQ
jgi:DNA-binding IclR family transcriptional regulator